MPAPGVTDVHIDTFLTNVSVAYVQAAKNYVHDQIFPVVPVEFQSDLYYTYSKADFLRDMVEERADGAESAGTGYTLATTPYLCKVYALHKQVTKRQRANADSVIKPDKDAAMFLAQQMLIKRERQWCDTFFKAAVWGTTIDFGTSAGTQWTTELGKPINDIEVGIEKIAQESGMMPNCAVIGRKAWRVLKHHKDVVDRYKHTSPESITTDMVARLVELDRIIVARAIRNTAGEGASGSYSFIASDDAMLLAYVTDTPSLQMPSAGYTFEWTGVNGTSSPMTTAKYAEPLKKADRIETEYSWDFKAIATDCGYFLDNLVV